MLRQPHPDYIVKPMPADMPSFSLQPLERAKTDRAANDETPAEREFRMDGAGGGRNLTAAICAVVALLALALMGFMAALLIQRAYLQAVEVFQAYPIACSIALAVIALAVVLAGVAIRARDSLLARREAEHTRFGELA